MIVGKHIVWIYQMRVCNFMKNLWVVIHFSFYFRLFQLDVLCEESYDLRGAKSSCNGAR